MKSAAKIFFFLTVLFVAGSALAAQGGPGKVAINGFVIDVKSEMQKVQPDMKDEAGRKKWIVQFSGPVRQHYKDRLASLGCGIGDYLPEFAFIVSMDNKTKRAVDKLPFVRGVIRYKPDYKIDRKIKPDAEKFHVRVDGEESIPAVLSQVHRMKGKVLDVRKEVVRIETDRAGVRRLSRMEEVLWIEEAVPMELLNDTTKWVIQNYLYGDTKIWDHGIHGEGQIVGIGDTGLDYDMPWFIDPGFTPVGPTHRKVVGYDDTFGNDYDADFGHGTHVAGTVGGDRTPVDGLDGANGMAPKAKLYIQDLTPGEVPSINVPADLGACRT